MKINSREYGYSENEVRIVTINCTIEEGDSVQNQSGGWKAKRDWTFEYIKYELLDEYTVHFEELDKFIFTVSLGNKSEHDIYDDLHKFDSDDYLVCLITMYLTKAFINRYSYPDFPECTNVFNYHIQMIDIVDIESFNNSK